MSYKEDAGRPVLLQEDGKSLMYVEISPLEAILMSYEVPDHDEAYDRAMAYEEAEEAAQEDEHEGEICAYPGCGEPAIALCECCKLEKPFCGDHGSKGGDREGDEDSLCVAVPSACWECGGFNVDEEDGGKHEAADREFTAMFENGEI